MQFHKTDILPEAIISGRVCECRRICSLPGFSGGLARPEGPLSREDDFVNELRDFTSCRIVSGRPLMASTACSDPCTDFTVWIHMVSSMSLQACPACNGIEL